MIANKDEEIRTLKSKLSTNVSNIQREAALDISLANATMHKKVCAAESQSQASKDKMNATIRAERAIAARKVQAMSSRHKKVLDFELRSVKERASDQTSQLEVVVDSERERAAGLLLTISKERQEVVDSKKKHGDSLTELKQNAKLSKRELRTELASTIAKQKKEIGSLSLKLKSSDSARIYMEAKTEEEMGRIMMERDLALDTAKRRLGVISDANESIASLRDQVESFGDSASKHAESVAELKVELERRDSTISSLQGTVDSLERECAEATEEIVVSVIILQ